MLGVLFVFLDVRRILLGSSAGGGGAEREALPAYTYLALYQDDQ